MTAVTIIINTFCWTAFVVGILFNGLMIRLIIGHTPEPMRIYSKILLQTCVVDILFLFMTLLFTPKIDRLILAFFPTLTVLIVSHLSKFSIVTARGESELFVYGLVTIKGVDNRFWNVWAISCWVFLAYASLFGYVAQFIFRYLALVRDKSISTPKYFLLLFVMLLFQFVYCCNSFICYYPPADHALMDDNSTAQMFGINLDTQKIVLAGYSFNDIRLTIGYYYLIIVCTIAYVIIFSLAFRIQKFLNNKLKESLSSAITQKLIKMNEQVSRNLIIQASLPLFIYFPFLFGVVLILFKVNALEWQWFYYFNLTTTIATFWPSALNPIVSICTIQYYRSVIILDIKYLAKFIKQMIGQRGNGQTNLNRLNTDKWATSVIKTN